jgi:hypothetical protein
MSLFIISLIFLTPDYVYSLLTPYQKDFHNSKVQELLKSYLKPMIDLMINFVVIPFFIDLSCEYEDFRRKSSRQISIMRRIYIFMLINTLIIPLCGNYVSKLMMEDHLDNDDIKDFLKHLSDALIENQFKYIQFII